MSEFGMDSPLDEIKDLLRLKSWKGVVDYIEKNPGYTILGIRELCHRSTSTAKVVDSVEPVVKKHFLRSLMATEGLTLNEYVEKTIEKFEAERDEYVETDDDMVIKLNRTKFEIEWNGMELPINHEIWDDWSLSKKMYDAEELIVPIRIVYIPDEDWEEFLEKNFAVDMYPDSDIRTPEGHADRLLWNWQTYMTRGVSYRGRIYIKRSAHRDRALLLHEIGHTVPFLEHTEVWKPGIMNPISAMWEVDGDNIR